MCVLLLTVDQNRSANSFLFTAYSSLTSLNMLLAHHVEQRLYNPFAFLEAVARSGYAHIRYFLRPYMRACECQRDTVRLSKGR